MKQRIISLGVALLLLLATMSLSGCIDKSKWRAKDLGGPPNWEEDYGRPGYDW
ncbi:MAG: hypothetical protein GY846_14520 [Deltaproteobacteria bacterium]|nr:hypothetical protein [Deltaproteobacteria bacterium]